MITYSKIGKKGHLGNQLFQIASTIGLSVSNNQDFAFLDWKFQEYFKNKLPHLTDFSDFINVEEKEYHHHQWNLESGNYDISGWLQTEKYFDAALTKHYFEFSDLIISRLKNLYAEAFQKRTILLSIRRGDFVNHPDYFQLSIQYYLNSLKRFFPDWESSNLIILSDDIKYCKFHFSFLKNAFFGDGLSGIEQLCLGSLCDDFIISNSTFSWWTAWLGEKSDSKIIRPLKNFDGLKSKELNDKDYYPERWINYNHLEDKIKLEDVIFDIKAKKNRDELVAYILSYFDVKINSNNEEADSSKHIYVLKKDYFLPPFVIYSSYLKLKDLNNTLIINMSFKSFKVSKPLNYEEFLAQKDFGLFSAIFSNKDLKVGAEKNNRDIYLKRNTVLMNNSDKVIGSNESVINFSGGEFRDFGGYAFSVRRFIKKKKILLKKSIKKMLSIK
ncbi:glycosyl transferase family 11 [Flavobacterium chryseum]|uniref:alpha-1,2-fucosyltransferase n=1 Tax=Flavobacterium sp. P3160 TaxID=2512113 RepID=UPI00105EBF1B|nr:alpha-1,2-fucosyltransferase [Flavobacterium sp. P3160]TDO77477.1 glycosyl transferase family 11 [Flavobacterium sp. P3160]